MVNSMWTQGLTKEDSEEFLRVLSLETDSVVYKRLKSIIETKRKSLECSERTPDNYNNPNWAYLQAHNNGSRQMLVMLENLLTTQG